ncbi:7-deoxyloganetin glucosyltransferase-like [Lolium rigidum]|uniref:7-deoxyloganetin glucosyltransferase-like n=1 Tax=Lolium rigidum TaxID=89674 RepID=UPI001F5DF000|nr:7-deoxyloganetin glucosyltransferase-like [Lolium rigidum]
MSRPHAVLIPYPAQGHVTPLLHLAKVLHARGFFVTFVNSEYNHRRLLRSRGADSLAGLDDFRFETIPDGLPPCENDDVTQDIPSLCTSFATHGAALLRDLLARLDDAGRPPVSCLIPDGVMSFALEVAEEMGIPALVFWTTSACGFMGYLHFAELIDRGYVPLKDESYLTNGYLDTMLDWVPGMPGIRLRDMPSFVRTTDRDDVMLNFDSGEAQNAHRAQGVILNTFDAVEQDVVDALRRIFPRVYTVGPLPALAVSATRARPEQEAIGGNLWKEDASCVAWLDGQQQPGSVVYVNFGSITVMSHAHLIEFAWGLARCGRPLLWVIRPDLVAGETAVLPEEFVDETKDRGIFLSWCPQEQVLGHPAIGLFLTHSGWNSTQESICAGVPMICWPFFAEQMTNCRYVCAEWGIGLEIDSSVRREDVARLVLEAMDGDKGKDMRAKAAMWKEKAVAATEEGGTSSIGIGRLVEFLLGRSNPES